MHVSRKNHGASDPPQPGAQNVRETVPMPARWLGGLGAVPFVALAAATYLVDTPLAVVIGFALLVYGAVILSFLGGIQWGMAISRQRPERGRVTGLSSLFLTVVPSLVGWGAVLLGGPAGLVLLAVSFAAVLRYDIRLAGRGEAPDWYPTLRWPLTLAVVAALVAAALRSW